jgi:hypothetical protein
VFYRYLNHESSIADNSDSAKNLSIDQLEHADHKSEVGFAALLILCVVSIFESGIISIADNSDSAKNLSNDQTEHADHESEVGFAALLILSLHR